MHILFNILYVYDCNTGVCIYLMDWQSLYASMKFRKRMIPENMNIEILQLESVMCSID